MKIEQNEYSERVLGDTRNYKWSVNFDKTDGYVGITQHKDEGEPVERILLSPTQVKALLAFVGKK